MTTHFSSTADSSLTHTARRLSRLAVILALLTPPLVVVQHVFFDASSFPSSYGMPSLLTGQEWSLDQRLLASLAALFPALAIMVALLSLGRICREYAHGRLFSDTVLSAWRRLGCALVVATALHWLQPTVQSLLLSLTLPEGHRFISVGVSSEDLLLALLTAVVFMLGAVMQVAQRVQSENAEIV